MHPLEKILNPRSVAYIGGSNSLLTPGTAQLVSILEGGFKGDVFPIHRREETVLGLKAYKSVSELPYAVDLIILAIPAKSIPSVLRECGRKGIKHAIVITAGFSEVGDKSLEREITQVSAEEGIRFTGPNCLGVNNPYGNFNCTWFSYKYKEGHTALISQSGSYAAHLNRYLERRGIPVRCLISVGNQANIDVVDCLEYLRDDERTKAIGMYLEGVKDGRRFLEEAKKTSLKKPVVALYVGGTESGARAGASHTAALSAPDEIYQGVFKQAGIIRVYSMEDLFDICHVFTVCPLPKGKRVAILTNSGGPAASMADACEREGVEVPLFADSVQNRIKEFLSPTASSKNPVDLTMVADPNTPIMGSIPKIIYEENAADAILVYGIFGEQHIQDKAVFMENLGVAEIPQINAISFYMDEVCQELVRFVHESGLPVLGSSYWGRDDKRIAYLQDLGIPMLIGPERAVRALSALWRYSKWRKENQ